MCMMIFEMTMSILTIPINLLFYSRSLHLLQSFRIRFQNVTVLGDGTVLKHAQRNIMGKVAVQNALVIMKHKSVILYVDV